MASGIALLRNPACQHSEDQYIKQKLNNISYLVIQFVHTISTKKCICPHTHINFFCFVLVIQAQLTTLSFSWCSATDHKFQYPVSISHSSQKDSPLMCAIKTESRSRSRSTLMADHLHCLSRTSCSSFVITSFSPTNSNGLNTEPQCRLNSISKHYYLLRPS